RVLFRSDGAVDVVPGHRGLLRLLDGVVQRRVAGRVTTTGTGSHLDVLDQPGEQLASLGVDRRLLVLGRRPLGVPRHGGYLSFVTSAPPTAARSSRGTRGGSSGRR